MDHKTIFLTFKKRVSEALNDTAKSTSINEYMHNIGFMTSSMEHKHLGTKSPTNSNTFLCPMIQNFVIFKVNPQSLK